MTSSVKSNVDKDDLICPITYQIFRDPVIVGDGHTYERTAIVRWVAEHGTSPLTREPLNLNELQTNDYLKNLAAQRRSSSLSSNYDINLDQPVIQRQNSIMSYYFHTYIDRPVAIRQETMIDNDIVSMSNPNNTDTFPNDGHRELCMIIVSVIMGTLLFAYLLTQFNWLDIQKRKAIA